MNVKYYKITIITLCMLLLFVAAVAYSYVMAFFDRPSLAEDKRLAYEAYICELQMELDYPVCQIGGGFGPNRDVVNHIMVRTNTTMGDAIRAFYGAGGNVDEAVRLAKEYKNDGDS